MEIHNKRELQQIAINHSAEIDYKILWRLIEKVQVNHTLFLTIDTTLQPNNFLRFRKNILNAL